ncbi:MAG: hypothetical protein ACNYPE_02710 [Candidatus Azotimanducaceae bacterium WSBS_2022_MAG_OTU7]
MNILLPEFTTCHILIICRHNIERILNFQQEMGLTVRVIISMLSGIFNEELHKFSINSSCSPGNSGGIW